MDPNLQHSAEIDMYLEIDGERLEVGQCLGNRCILQQPIDLPPCSAALVIVVDGKVHRREIYLRNGLSADVSEVEFDIKSELISQ